MQGEDKRRFPSVPNSCLREGGTRAPLPWNHSFSARLTCLVAEGKCFLKLFLKAKCSRSLRKAEAGELWASQPCLLVLLHCCVASPAEPCPSSLSEQLHSILCSLSCWPHILFAAKYWDAEDTVINFVLTPLCCLWQIYRCAPEPSMNIFFPYHCKISVCLSIYLFTWVALQMGKSSLENSICRLQVWGQTCLHSHCVLCCLFKARTPLTPVVVLCALNFCSGDPGFSLQLCDNFYLSGSLLPLQLLSFTPVQWGGQTRKGCCWWLGRHECCQHLLPQDSSSLHRKLLEISALSKGKRCRGTGKEGEGIWQHQK